MVDHISRKVSILLTLLVVSAAALWFMGFRLGLDLQGGTRLVYSVDIDKAVASGDISEEQAQNKDALMNELIEIWLKRVDPQGVKGVVIRKEGDSGVVIELPGSASASRRNVSIGLESPVGLEDKGLLLAKDSSLDPIEQEKVWSDFPATGGVIQIGAEQMRYTKRVGNNLRGLVRGDNETEVSAHDGNAIVKLKASDPWRQLIENTGDMHFMIAAEDSDLVDPTNPRNTTDLIREKEAVDQWIMENPGVDIEDYNAEMALREGPVSRLRWYPETTNDPEAKLQDLVQPLIIEEDPAWRFDGTDFPNFFQSQDQLGLPAVGFKSTPEKRSLFGDFTEEHKNKQMAIVINNEIVTFPKINGRLQGEGVIEGGPGGFTADEVNQLVSVLRSGSLRVKPDFEAQETVGATLGQDYVNRGFFSAVLGILVVLIFMMVYYRRLGVLAGISLVYNLVLLLGAMAFIQATLTLPGVAGIILTVGMAVDANILIYERIREETLKGRKPIQAAKDGFKNATSTILDANITTLITGLILYKVGSGPVRGFATTLCVSIITSLILTRLLVHWQVEKGVDRWSMMRWVTETRINFIQKAKMFIPVSVFLMVSGIGLFAALDNKDKLGIDFTGGTTATIRTAQAMSVDDVRAIFDPAQNDRIVASDAFTDSVTVAPIKSTSADGGYYGFRLTAKTEHADLATTREDILTYAEPILAKGPVTLTVADGTVTGKLYLETSVDAGALSAALASRCNVTAPEVTLADAEQNVYDFTGKVSAGKADNLVAVDIVAGLSSQEEDGSGALTLADPISELTAVGAQVVETLRDRAVLAIILSLFAAVMYIRVRFAEYSYGFAAVVALVHDVCITLGALAIMIWSGWIRAEIDLAMIAAFLTIIGYSLNDTIVVFDRVRENLPRMKGDMTSIVNKSINQTLSRTLLTSVTTLITVSLLFGFNFGTRNVIEGLSYALIIGVFVGTYSSMFIASPVLVWLESRRRASMTAEEREAADKAALEASQKKESAGATT